MLAVAVLRFAETLPAAIAARVVTSQLLRAATSIGANYREAARARSKLEFISKIGDCLKESDETSYWLELLLDENYITAHRLEPLLGETNELIAIMTTISKKAKGIE